MVKKALHIILVVLLLISTFGVTISKHYSGSELFSVALFGEADSCCENPCNCCSDEVDLYQLDMDYIVSYSDFQDVQKTDIPVDYFYSFLSNLSEQNTYTLQFVPNISPPIVTSSFTFLQVFRC